MPGTALAESRQLFCPRCRDRISENWSFCPRCGARLASSGSPSEDAHYSPLADLFKDIERQMKEVLGPNLSRDIEFFELKPDFMKKNPMLRPGQGFRIKITRAGDGPPTIDIKAFGDVDEKLAEKMRESLKAQSKEAAPEAETPKEEQSPIVESAEATPRNVSEYEEPRCTTKWTGDHLLVDLDLPGVAKGEDVEIRKLGESIEVRAFAGDKGYFKILGVPADAQLVSRRFRKGRLSLRIG